MKIFRAVAFLQLCLSLSACGLPDDENEIKGHLRISFEDGVGTLTKTGEFVPDTSDFLLTITDASGRAIYDGRFGDCPECLDVSAGSYMVKSINKGLPEKIVPQYGDEKCVIVPSGGTADVKLLCTQMNAGVRLNIDESFLRCCPDGVLFLKSSQDKLLYSYTEERIAYFKPGQVSLILSEGGKDEVLLSRNLEARQGLVLGVSAAGASSGSDFQGLRGISVAVDTSKIWMEDYYTIGGSSDKGSSADNAFTVALAISNGSVEDVWVSGYVVGGDLTSAAASFAGPFKSRTNILLGPRSSTVERSACIAVQLPSGKVRDALNLVDNPEMLGRKVCLKGDIVEAYYGLVGLKNVEAFER